MKNETNEDRKPYEKPDIRRVTLKPEESLAAGCKMIGMSASTASPCSVNGCFADGS